MADEEKKLYIDDDWKEQARKEKEEAERASQEIPESGDIPAPQIAEIIQMLIMQISIGLGGMQDPQSGKPIPPNLGLAKHYIDLLELFGQKTEGNLNDEEKQILEGTLHEVRMAFVQIAQGEQPGGGPAGQVTQ